MLTEAEEGISFRELEEQELEEPNIPIMDGDTPVYKTRATMLELSGIPILTDFGQMQVEGPDNREWSMPDLYRAPEVLLGLPWGFPVDVWSVGVMVSEKDGLCRRSSMADWCFPDIGASRRKESLRPP